MTDTIGSTAVEAPSSYRVMTRVFTVLRVFTGLVWLSNAIAKVIDVGNYDFGFISFNLVTKGVAKALATGASSKTYIAPLGWAIRTWCCPTGVSSASSLPSPSSPSASV